MSLIYISTPRLIIRSPLMIDATVLSASIYASAPELRQWMPWAKHLPTLDDTIYTLEDAITKAKLDEEYWLLIFTLDGTFVGSTGLHNIDWRKPSGEIGYWIDSQQVGQGYASEAIDAIAKFARDTMGLRRIQITTSDRNTRSWRVAERANFTLEGVLREHRINPDGERDHTRVYAITSAQAQGRGNWAKLHTQAR